MKYACINLTIILSIGKINKNNDGIKAPTSNDCKLTEDINQYLDKKRNIVNVQKLLNHNTNILAELINKASIVGDSNTKITMIKKEIPLNANNLKLINKANPIIYKKRLNDSKHELVTEEKSNNKQVNLETISDNFRKVINPICTSLKTFKKQSHENIKDCKTENASNVAVKNLEYLKKNNPESSTTVEVDDNNLLNQDLANVDTTSKRKGLL